jgi:two-component system sensor histidine kinase QseC
VNTAGTLVAAHATAPAPPPRQTASIRGAIVRWVSAAVLLACAAAFVTAFLFVRHRVLRQLDGTLAARAEIIAGLLQYKDRELAIDEADEAFASFQGGNAPAYYEIRSTAGRTLIRSPALKTALDIAPATTMPAGHQAVDATLPDGRRGRVYAIIAPPHTGHAGELDSHNRARVDGPDPVWVLVADDTRQAVSTLRSVGWSFAAAFGGIALVLLWAVPSIVRRGLRPLDVISDQASRLDVSTLSDRFPTAGLPAELTPIASQLNASLDRLAAAFDRERRFAASAAHELRTPLAAIRANAEVALRWPDPEQTRTSLQDVLTAACRMQSLCDRLLELARLGGRDALTLEPTPLRPLVDASLALAEDVTRRRGVRVAVDVPDHAAPRSNAELLGPLLDNVMLNAARHAPAGAEVRVSWADGTLSAGNPAPDLSPSDLPLMFQPLWTKSTDRAAGHAGLGLALVAEYARVLDVTLTPALDGGAFTLSMRFPA